MPVMQKLDLDLVRVWRINMSLPAATAAYGGLTGQAFLEHQAISRNRTSKRSFKSYLSPALPNCSWSHQSTRSTFLRSWLLTRRRLSLAQTSNAKLRTRPSCNKCSIQEIRVPGRRKRTLYSTNARAAVIRSLDKVSGAGRASFICFP